MKTSNDMSDFSAEKVQDVIRYYIKDGDIDREWRVGSKLMKEYYMTYGDVAYAYGSVKDPHIVKHRRLCSGVYALYLQKATL